MRIWIDTEFNGFKGEMIALALVAEDGSEFYEVLYCANPHPWVAQNVIPVLGQIPVSVETLRTKLRQYLAKFDSVHIIADWPEDLANFCDVMVAGDGYCISTPKLSMEIRRDIQAYGDVPHNALEDARANMAKHIDLELNPKPSVQDFINKYLSDNDQ